MEVDDEGAVVVAVEAVEAITTEERFVPRMSWDGGALPTAFERTASGGN
jgi:hypothetical protein